MERYTSASDMRFNSNELRVTIKKLKKRRLVFIAILVTCYSVLVTVSSHAEIIDRVVAFVDERAITLSEFNEAYEKARKIRPDSSKEDVLDTMINRVLLLAEAKKLKLEARTEDELISEYMDMKVKAFIRVREEELEDFYKKNVQEFKGAGYDAVRDKIEEYLVELETNRLLKRHISELRARSHIKVMLQQL